MIKYSALFIAAALLLIAAPNSAYSGVVRAEIPCPESLQITAAIDAFTVSDTEDEDFETLSGQSFQVQLTRLSHDDSSDCLLMERNTATMSLQRRFVELRPNHDGTVSLELEGYTPNSHKLYSIRAKADPSDLAGRLDAGLFDGSGPSRERLSTATLTLESLPSD